MQITDIKVRDEDGNINHLMRAMLDQESGMVGRSEKKDKRRQISILSKKIRDLIDEEQLDGLCLFRFYENITIEGLDAREISTGEKLQIGETVLRVTSIGKGCFEECKLVQAGKRCELFNNVIFTSVVEGGFIEIDDRVEVIS